MRCLWQNGLRCLPFLFTALVIQAQRLLANAAQAASSTPRHGLGALCRQRAFNSLPFAVRAGSHLHLLSLAAVQAAWSKPLQGSGALAFFAAGFAAGAASCAWTAAVVPNATAIESAMPTASFVTVFAFTDYPLMAATRILSAHVKTE